MLDAIAVHYEIIGEGTPILMLHGWPYDHTHMAFEMERHFVLRPGWQRIYIDLPGMGRTHGVDWISTSDDVLTVLEQFIDRLIPNRRFLVAGLSYGGYLARGLIFRRGEVIDGALLSVPSTDYPARDVPSPLRIIRDPSIVAQALDDGIEWFEHDTAIVAETPSMLDYARVINAVPPSDYAFLSRLRVNRAFSFDVDSPPRPFKAPSLFILGRQDSSVGYRRQWELIENFPRATFAVLDGAGHFVWGEKTVLCEALVIDWLDRVEQWMEGT